jgi:hypothetical protein
MTSSRPEARSRLVIVVSVTLVAVLVLLASSRCGSNEQASPDNPAAATEAEPAGTTESPESPESPDDPAPPDEAAQQSESGEPDGDGQDGGQDAAASSTTSTTSVVGTNDPAAPLADPDVTGRQLAQRFLNILASPNRSVALDEFLSPAFQLQRANGTFADRSEYISDPSVVGNFTILDEDFRARQDGSVLTVRFSVDAQEAAGSTNPTGGRAERLAVFMRTDQGWQLVAWSNFNPPAPAP